MRWRWPPESCAPSSPTMRVHPVGQRLDPVADAGPRGARRRSRSSVAPGRARRTFSRIVALKCARPVRRRRTSRERLPGGSRARPVPSSVTRPGSGSRKRSSRLTTVVLPDPLGPTSATLRPGVQPQARPGSTGGSRASSGRRRCRARQHAGVGPARARPGREPAAHDRRARGRDGRRASVAESSRAAAASGVDGFEGRERKQRERRRRTRGRGARVVCYHGRREHRRERQLP